jgi:hypothetical protein
MKFLQSIVKPIWCIIDVRANFGYYALSLGQLVGRLGLVRHSILLLAI